MQKTIMIGDREIPFKATASTPRRYREKFGGDLLVDINKVMPKLSGGSLSEGDLQVFENMAYVMARQADPEIPENPDDWLDLFEILDLYQALPQLIELWGINTASLADEKKRADRQSVR